MNLVSSLWPKGGPCLQDGPTIARAIANPKHALLNPLPRLSPGTRRRVYSSRQMALMPTGVSTS